MFHSRCSIVDVRELNSRALLFCFRLYHSLRRKAMCKDIKLKLDSLEIYIHVCYMQFFNASWGASIVIHKLSLVESVYLIINLPIEK